MKAVHLAYVHRADDVRIYCKECISLSQAGYKVVYITALSKNVQYKPDSGVKICELDIDRNGVSRVFHPIRYFRNQRHYKRLLYKVALEEHADVYHIHEYHLLKLGLLLKKKTGAKIIYDIHEDVPRQQFDKFEGKGWLMRQAKYLDIKTMECIENRRASLYDHLITVTRTIFNRFLAINPNTSCVYNYPILRQQDKKELVARPNFCYIGVINELRGILQIVSSLEGTKYTLELIGDISIELLQKLSSTPGWENVIYHGYLTREQANLVLRRCIAGIVTFLPCGNHINALPNKLFEYMSACIPVIASNFPLWREIIEGNECGICVDPHDVTKIRNAMTYIYENPEKAQAMGERGRHAVFTYYNWETESKKLTSIYEKLVSGNNQQVIE